MPPRDIQTPTEVASATVIHNATGDPEQWSVIAGRVTREEERLIEAAVYRLAGKTPGYKKAHLVRDAVMARVRDLLGIAA